ncbi:NAD-dependent epimerase/dehydratase family protein [Rhizobium oryzicola]|uniref:GDP-mannose 4,6-dehydratase n=1 Tax=Rhizobium oryzicola TaxID=1232668 RepID=A0ABT8T4T1_9HYPH|nr:NAD-dependent epimerase/dehydratase family protein [Rhizobium oryzicola]MDO1585580.1 GDP-mannose 4,6-dehydratase [Rhizobium oryzicola]
MSNRRLLITGSQGFVGRALIERIRASAPDRFELVDFIDPENGERPDIRDKAAVERALTSAKPDAVVHLAAIAAPRQAQKDPSEAWMVNVIGTLNIASAARTIGARLIWSGSSEAYGNAFNRHPEPVREEAALEPMSAYGATKSAADLMLRQMGEDGLQAVIFRPFNHSGPGQSPDYVVPAFAEQVARIEAGLQDPVIKVGNLEARRDFLHVTDVVDAYLAAADAPSIQPGATYNISTSAPVAIADLLNGLLTASGHAITVEVDPARYFPNKVVTASGSHDRLKADFGWSPKIAIGDMLAEVLDDQRQRIAAEPRG